MRRQHRLDLVDGAAEIAVLEPRGDERHLPQVLAHQLGIARLRRSIVTSAEAGVSCPSCAADHRLGEPSTR